jgi:DNA-binding MarR family transcriptional regulator
MQMTPLPRDEAIGAIDDLLRDILGNFLRPETPPNRELNVTMGQLHCLMEIARLGTPTMSALAAALGLHPSTVTVLVDGLVAHGLAVRKADPVDRRIVRVAETAKGRKNHERHMAAMRARVTEVLSELGDGDLESIRTSLWTLREAARRHVEGTPGKSARGAGPAVGATVGKEPMK